MVRPHSAAVAKRRSVMFKSILGSIAVAMIAIAPPANSQQSPPTSAQAKQIEAMVNKASALVEKQGKAAFSEFRKRESEWWFGNTYVFIYDQNLNVLLNPAFPKREGTNPHGEKDANGKAFHDEFLKMVQTNGSGWVDYMFPKPGETQPSGCMVARRSTPPPLSPSAGRGCPKGG